MNKTLYFIKHYKREQFFSDILAGFVVGTVALPLSISFATAAGLSPITGIFSTIIAGFIVALLSGSRVQISGPTAATIVIVYSILNQYGQSGLIIATIIAGILLILMGVFKFGRIIRLIPEPLIEGITAGIAVDLFVSQFKNGLGLNTGQMPPAFIDKCYVLITHIGSINLLSVALTLATVVINQLSIKYVTHKIPGPIIAITITSLAVWVFKLPATVIGNNFGDLGHFMPQIVMPHADWLTVAQLVKPGFTIAVLVGIMSLVSGLVAERHIDSKFKSNKELIAEGVANLFSSLFGGIPVTGSIARTMTNVENGGRSRLSGIMQSVTLLVVVLSIGRWIAYIPVASIAGLLFVVAFNMGKWKTFWAILKSGIGDASLLVITFFATLFIDVSASLEIGLAFAAFQFMNRMALVSNVRELTNNFMAVNGLYIEEHIVKHDVPPNVAVFEINGPLFFGVSHKFKHSVEDLKVKPQIVIIRMRSVPIIDSTGMVTIVNVANSLAEQNIQLVLAEYKYDRVDEKLNQMVIKKLGKDNVLGTLGEAVTRCWEIQQAATKS